METIVEQFKIFFNNIKVSITRSLSDFYSNLVNLVGEQLTNIILIVGGFLIVYIILNAFLNRK